MQEWMVWVCKGFHTKVWPCLSPVLQMAHWRENQWTLTTNQNKSNLLDDSLYQTISSAAEQGQVAPSMDPWKSGRSGLALQPLKTSKLGIWWWVLKLPLTNGCSVKPTSLPSHSAHHFPLKRFSCHLSWRPSCHLSWNASSSDEEWMLCKWKPIQLMRAVMRAHEKWCPNQPWNCRTKNSHTETVPGV